MAARPQSDFSLLYASMGRDVQEYFGERAGIMEFDGGLSRDEAERQAHAATVKWVEEQIRCLESAERVYDRAVELAEHAISEKGMNPNELYARPINHHD